MPAHNTIANMEKAAASAYDTAVNFAGQTITCTGVTASGAVIGGGAAGAALTAQLTTLTPADAEGTPDYATAGLTQTTPFGFVAAQEGITVLYVIKNLQERVAQIEQRLEEKGLIAAN